MWTKNKIQYCCQIQDGHQPLLYHINCFFAIPAIDFCNLIHNEEQKSCSLTIYHSKNINSIDLLCEK